MSDIRVEYLVPVSSDAGVCNSVAALNHLLRSVDGISVAEKHVEFQGLRVSYECQLASTSNGDHRLFHLKFTCSDDKSLPTYDTLLRSVRSVLARTTERPVHVLWDGVAFVRAASAYPKLYDLENLMRKLITKFMFMKVGLTWTEQTVPQEVRDSIRTKAPRHHPDYLYEVDFIQLSNFLFKKYAGAELERLIDTLSQASSPADINLDELKRALPRSNWDRYFSALVKCDGTYLSKRWERLYTLRNQVAHNKGLSHADLVEVERLTAELRPILDAAVSALESVKVPEEEKEAIAENAAVNRNALYGEFITAWSQLQRVLFAVAHRQLREKLDLKQVEMLRFSPGPMIQSLSEPGGPISASERADLLELLAFRNRIIHMPDTITSDAELRSRAEDVAIYTMLLSGIDEVQRTKEALG